jgi:hypothetical protein
MLRLKSRQATPPGGFQFTDPTTGHTIKTHSWSNFMRLIDEHRDGNGLVPVSIDIAEDQCCQNIPPSARSEFCEDADRSTREALAVQLTHADIFRGTRTVAAFKLSGQLPVAQAEANRRSEICAGCPFNRPFVKPCGGLCAELIEIVRSFIGGARTSHEDRLEACGVCHCALTAKVWLPMEHLRRYESAALTAKYPAHCWMVEEK